MANSNGFNPMDIQGVSDEARKAVAKAFDAMSHWRDEMNIQGEKMGNQMFDAMAQAAKTMGWPAEIVETTRQQMQGVTKMQTQMVDQLMNAWEAQLKSPNPMGGFPTEMMKNLQSLPGFSNLANMPGMDAWQNMMGHGMGGMNAANPFQFWMQMGEQWQKNWAQAMSMWASGGKR
jgi:hypothetical protein